MAAVRPGGARERISGFSIGMAVLGFILAAIFILAMVGAVLLLNSETLPQNPLLLGPPR